MGIDDERRSQTKEFMDDLAYIEKILVVPLVDKLDQRFEQMERQWEQFRGDMRAQFQQNEAFLRTITDPIVGYVPRTQIQIDRESAEKERDELKREIIAVQRSCDEEISDIRSELSRFPYWLISTGLAAIGVAVAIVALFHH